MDLRLADPLRALADEHGFVTRADALAMGCSDADLGAMVRGQVLVRFRRGSYAFADDWSGADPRQRHVVRCRAVLRSLGAGVVLSHTSASVVQGLAVWGHDLSRVHVTRLDGGSPRIEADVVHHVGRVDPAVTVTVDGLPVVPAVRAALETGSLGSGESALVVLDSLLHLGHATERELFAQFTSMADWPSTRMLHLPVRMADGRSESVGESRMRWLCWRHRLPMPELQHEVYAEDGTLVGRCDFAWPELGVLGEFDGEIKYGRLLRPGQSAGDVVFAEKCREDRIREITGLPMIRVVWSDLDDPGRLVARLRRLMSLQA